jgi:hypothetical protein
MRETLYEANAAQHVYPEKFCSILEDLPIVKARNSYSKIINGKIELINGGPKGLTDIFYFPFCAIGTKYVDKINGTMLNESHQIDRIVISSKISEYNSLSHYTIHGSQHRLDADRLENIKKLRHSADLLQAVVPEQTKINNQPKPDKFLIDSFSEDSDKLVALFRRYKKAAESYFELSKCEIKDQHQVLMLYR